MFSELEKGQVIAACVQHLEANGLTVEQVGDFTTIEGIVRDVQKEYFTPVVSPNFNDLTASNAIWLVARRDGLPIIVGGARLEDLSSESVGTFWPRSLERLYSKGPGELIRSVNPLLAKKLSGRLAYFGDLHVKPKSRGILDCVRSFVTIGHVLVSLKWDPDFTYAFIHEKGISRSADFRYGFNHSVPNAMSWINPPHPRSDKEWCCILSRDELPYVARSSVEAISGATTDTPLGGVFQGEMVQRTSVKGSEKRRARFPFYRSLSLGSG